MFSNPYSMGSCIPQSPNKVVVPVGTVLPYAGEVALTKEQYESPPGTYLTDENQIPQVPLEYYGWMLCDGRSLKIMDYPQLYAALGDLYTKESSGDDSGNERKFNIPDMRGMFLRGAHGDQNGADPEASDRKPTPKGKATGPGSIQGCALQDHKHKYIKPADSTQTFMPKDNGSPGVPAVVPETLNSNPDQTTMTDFSLSSDNGSNGVLLDNKTSSKETRPVNISVNFIIKFTY
jgi:microcystin-dependent protein